MTEIEKIRKQYYSDNLAELRERFPGRESISVPEAAKYLGRREELLRSDAFFPIRPIGKTSIVPLTNFARWLATV